MIVGLAAGLESLAIIGSGATLDTSPDEDILEGLREKEATPRPRCGPEMMATNSLERDLSVLPKKEAVQHGGFFR